MGNTAGAALDTVTGVEFSTVSGPFAPTGTRSSVAVPLPTAGTAQGLHVKLSGNATASIVFTIEENNAATGVKCTVLSGSNSCDSDGATAGFSAGDTIDIAIDNSSGDGAGLTASWELQY
jgi:hypothetical protein